MYTESHAKKLVDAYLRAGDISSGNAALKVLSIAFEEVIAENIANPSPAPGKDVEERAEELYPNAAAFRERAAWSAGFTQGHAEGQHGYTEEQMREAARLSGILKHQAEILSEVSQFLSTLKPAGQEENK